MLYLEVSAEQSKVPSCKAAQCKHCEKYFHFGLLRLSWRLLVKISRHKIISIAPTVNKYNLWHRNFFSSYFLRESWMHKTTVKKIESVDYLHNTNRFGKDFCTICTWKWAIRNQCRHGLWFLLCYLLFWDWSRCYFWSGKEKRITMQETKLAQFDDLQLFHNKNVLNDLRNTQQLTF